MKVRLLLFVCLMIGFVSCDYENNVYYLVENNTQDSVRLSYSYAANYFDENKTDTSIVLSPYQKDTIFDYTQISSSVYNPESESRIINVLFNHIIRLRDSASIQKDASLRKNWDFFVTGKYSAVLGFVIEDTDW